jgi:hypothetical protein
VIETCKKKKNRKAVDRGRSPASVLIPTGTTGDFDRSSNAKSEGVLEGGSTSGKQTKTMRGAEEAPVRALKWWHILRQTLSRSIERDEDQRPKNNELAS